MRETKYDKKEKDDTLESVTIEDKDSKDRPTP